MGIPWPFRGPSVAMDFRKFLTSTVQPLLDKEKEEKDKLNVECRMLK